MAGQESDTRQIHQASLILGSLAEGVFTVDPACKITFFNRAAEIITGFRATDVVGRLCSDVFRTELCDRDCPLQQSLRTGRTVKNFEIDILTTRGTTEAVSVSTAPLVASDGQRIGAVETMRDLSPIRTLRRELSGKYVFEDFVSKNAAVREIVNMLPRVAKSDAPVLLRGPRGTGKELLAVAIHNTSSRSAGPLEKVGCGAMPHALVDAEMFGQVRDTDPAASRRLVGRVEAANGGTLFLDEVGALPLAVQTKLLGVLDRGEMTPVGANEAMRVDVRVIAATGLDLERLVVAGRFDQHLLARLNAIPLRIPPLNERREDVPVLVQHFVDRLNHRIGRNIQGVTDKGMAVLMRYAFPGNVRELENVIEQAYVVTAGPLIDRRDLPPHVVTGAKAKEAASLRGLRSGAKWAKPALDVERRRLSRVLARNLWNIRRAAAELGMHRTTLWRRIKQLQIAPP